MYIGTSISAGEGQLNVRVMSSMGDLPIFYRLSDGKYFVASEPGLRFSVHLRRGRQVCPGYGSGAWLRNDA